MSHDELINLINVQIITAPPFALGGYTKFLHGLSAVVELHKPITDIQGVWCNGCDDAEIYPCPTIQVIEKELA